MNKLLDSFLDLKCPWHDTKISIQNETLFCKNCDGPEGAGNWDINRINYLLKQVTNERPATGRGRRSALQEKLLLLKEYYDEKSKTA